ncbi:MULTISPECIES: TetR/AcrR family transcriptional regulator [Salinicola]|uniref:TetR/AcrR family transcriptional regulator n=1 Tax=Salinicola TaxID=404432 RepID=UPI000DA13A51|nr:MULTISPECIES: TetR/AcrR family transcriptional regulator [Salinicola]
MSQPISPDAARGPAEHDVRDQIVAAAQAHFSRHGYDRTTVSELAKVIGISKAYIYKFFASKRAIGEVICSECLQQIDRDISAAVTSTDHPPEQLRRLFQTLVHSSLRLFSEDRNLYEIAAAAASEQWLPVERYEARVRTLVEAILVAGRRSGDFERKTPLDEVTASVCLVIRPYMHPVILKQSLEHVGSAPGLLSSFILRSLAP